MTQNVHGGQRTNCESRFFSFPILGIKLKSLGLAVKHLFFFTCSAIWQAQPAIRIRTHPFFSLVFQVLPFLSEHYYGCIILKYEIFEDY